MAKATAQPTAEKAPAKKAPAKAKAKAAASTSAPSIDIEKVAEEVLTKLKALNLEPQLQADIEWCLGSYRHDKNPTGLYEMAERAFGIFKAEQAKKTKGITTKLVSEVEKALKSRS